MITIRLHSTETVRIARGSKLAVELPNFCSAGYEWETQFDQAMLAVERQPLAHEGLSGESPCVFFVTAQAKGQHTLSFSLRRRWEPAPAEQRVLAVIAT